MVESEMLGLMSYSKSLKDKKGVEDVLWRIFPAEPPFVWEWVRVPTRRGEHGAQRYDRGEQHSHEERPRRLIDSWHGHFA